jgi:hypothetical protein
MSYPGFPLVPPFEVTASYQNEQYGTANSQYTPGIPSVFDYLVYPPTSGTTAETAATDAAEAVGFTGNPAQNAVQLITVEGTPTGGNYQLLWGDGVTTTLAFNAAASVLQTALNALSHVPAGTGGINDVQTATVSGATGGTFTLTFGGQTTAAIAFNATSAAVQAALAALSTIGTGTTGTYATQEITLFGGATGGTFTLTLGGQTTSALAFNATAATIQTALQALSSVGSGNATVEGQVGGPFNVAFAGTLSGPQALITGNATNLTGGAGVLNTVSATTVQTGTAGAPNVSVAGAAGGPYVVTFGGTLAHAAQSAITATSSLTGTSPTVAVAHTTTGTVATPSIAVTGSAGGPYTVTFQGALAATNVALIAPVNVALTGGTNPWVSIAQTTQGQALLSDSSTNYWAGNLALRNQVQQYDPMVYFYDAASGG